MTITRTLVLALNAYNATLKRARDDYRRRPTRSCPRPGCDQLAEGRLCKVHDRDRVKAGERKRRAA